MTEFVEEVRSRVVRLLRMANTTDDRLRKQIVAYADATPEPPIMGSLGIGTTGCPRCRRTMWQQRDNEGPVWVCAFCGHVESVTVICPHCAVSMEPPPAGWVDRWSCSECPRVAATGESAQEIDARERDRQRALALLDQALTSHPCTTTRPPVPGPTTRPPGPEPGPGPAPTTGPGPATEPGAGPKPGAAPGLA